MQGTSNSSTRLYVAMQGFLAFFVAAVHGVAAVLKGNTPTGGNLLASIGVFTLIPNYLFTGIATIIAAMALCIWTAGFIHRKHGPAVFLLLWLLLFLVGGGVAQVPFLILTWAVSTRIHKPLSWWRKVFSESTGSRLSKLWIFVFTAGYAFLTAGIGIWLILLPPGNAHSLSATDYVCWSCLAVGLLLQIVTIAAGFARDIERRGDWLPGKV